MQDAVHLHFEYEKVNIILILYESTGCHHPFSLASISSISLSWSLLVAFVDSPIVSVSADGAFIICNRVSLCYNCELRR